MDEKKIFVARQYRRALQLFAASLSDESTMMELADVYPKYSVGKAYKAGDIFGQGENADGETQLYQVLQNHTSAKEWTPKFSKTLYKQIGFSGSGIAIWTQPLGATDAYMQGDIVSHKEKTWVSTCDNNVWEPSVYGWTEQS